MKKRSGGPPERCRQASRPDGGHTQESVGQGRPTPLERPLESKIACVHLPNFAIEVCLRDHPELRDRPLALAESVLDDAEVVAANRRALDSGLLLHVTAAQGHILCPDLTIEVRETDREIEQSNAVYKKLQALSPLVEEAQTGLYFLDASGFEWLYPDDRRFALAIIAAVGACGAPPYPCRVGIGRNKFIAQVAAGEGSPDGFTIVPPGDEARFLQPLSLERLRTDQVELSDDTLERLRDLGLHTIGQAAAFPANEMIRRFGPEGEILSRLARGDDPDFFTPEKPADELTETVWFDYPVDRIETILKHTERLLARLLSDPGRYDRGCAAFEIGLYLDGGTPGRCRQASRPDGGNAQESVGQRRPTPPKQVASVPATRPGGSCELTPASVRGGRPRPPRENPTINGGPPVRITLERPTRSLRMLLRQLRITLEKQKPSAPILGLTVTIPVATDLRVEQLPLDDRLSPVGRNDAPPEAATSFTLARRSLDLPEERLHFASPDDPPEPETPSVLPHWAYHRHYSSAGGSLRLCRPARSIEVTFENDQPTAVRQTRVECDGPWELSGGWWSRDYDRHYWEIRDRRKRRFLIYLDRLSRRWFLQGIYD